METLNTIRENATILANAEIDWSPAGGMIWLTTLVGVMVLAMVIGFASGNLR